MSRGGKTTCREGLIDLLLTSGMRENERKKGRERERKRGKERKGVRDVERSGEDRGGTMREREGEREGERE